MEIPIHTKCEKPRRNHEIEAKWVCLGFFIVQNSALLTALRYCTIFSDPTVSYISSTAVLFAELLKLLLSLTLCLIFDANGSLENFAQTLYRGFVHEKTDCLKLIIPAALYTVQNNLQYVIETAPLFQVLYHLKLLTTAAFYTTVLAQKVTPREWMTIISLLIGVSMVQLSQRDIQHHHASYLVGIESVIIACLTSGLAGVHFEQTLKASKSSIWLINTQLSFLCTGLAFLACWFKDFDNIREGGFMRGYNGYVIIVVTLQSISGLVSTFFYLISSDLRENNLLAAVV